MSRKDFLIGGSLIDRRWPIHSVHKISISWKIVLSKNTVRMPIGAFLKKLWTIFWNIRNLTLETIYLGQFWGPVFKNQPYRGVRAVEQGVFDEKDANPKEVNLRPFRRKSVDRILSRDSTTGTNRGSRIRKSRSWVDPKPGTRRICTKRVKRFLLKVW